MPAPIEIRAELVAAVLSVDCAVGDVIAAGAVVVVLESMKMEIPVLAETAGEVTEVRVAVGDLVQEGDALVTLASVAAK